MFDDSLLDDEAALRRVDLRLRHLAEAGSRVRRDAGCASEAVLGGAERLGEGRPRALLVAGPDSRLLRAVLEPWCPVPFVAWPHAQSGGPQLPGWAGSLDVVVVLAPEGDHPESAAAGAEALRRGCALVVVAPERSLAAEPVAGSALTGASGRLLLPTTSGDPLGAAVVALDLLHRVGLAPREDADEVADALDAVAVEASPFRDLATNPAKAVAGVVADTNPLVWGGSVLAARASRRVAEAVRRATGRSAVAGDAEQLLPVLEAAQPADVFHDPVADPFDDGGPRALRPSLVVLDDGAEEPAASASRAGLVRSAEERGVRVEALTTRAEGRLARYASLVATGQYVATYLDVGLS